MARSINCGEGKHDGCHGEIVGASYLLPQTAEYPDRPCACGCHGFVMERPAEDALVERLRAYFCDPANEYLDDERTAYEIDTSTEASAYVRKIVGIEAERKAAKVEALREVEGRIDAQVDSDRPLMTRGLLFASGVIAEHRARIEAS